MIQSVKVRHRNGLPGWHTSGVTRVAMTAASVSDKRLMMAAICSADLPAPQITSGKPVLAARHVSTCQPGFALFCSG